MKKVYLVTSGQYSDYEVVAVFSEKKLAQEYIDSHGEYSEFNDVQERYFNPISKKKRKDLYAFQIDINERLGIERIYSYEYLENDAPIIRYVYAQRLQITLMAKSREHAIKSAVDKARQIKATVGWGKLID